MVHELLRYRPANNLYDDSLDQIAELINATGEAPTPSRSPRPPSSLAGDVAHGAPPPPPMRGVDPDPRREAPQCNPLRKASVCNEASCQVVQRPQGEARMPPAPQHQARIPP